MIVNPYNIVLQLTNNSVNKGNNSEVDTSVKMTLTKFLDMNFDMGGHIVNIEMSHLEIYT